MKYREYIVSLFIIAGITGCATKGEKEFYHQISKESSRYESLRDTEKLILGSSKEDETIVLISYLGSIDNSERFIVSIQQSGEETPIKSITLEGHKPLSKERVSRSRLPKSIQDIIPKWFDSYIYTFAPIDIKRFRIIVETKKGVDKSIYFYKDRRYRVDNKSRVKLL